MQWVYRYLFLWIQGCYRCSKRLGNKYDPVNLFPETYNYDVWFENEESVGTTRKSDRKESVDLSGMPPLEGNEEVNKGKGLKTLTLNKY